MTVNRCACGTGINHDRNVCDHCTEAAGDVLRAYWYRAPSAFGSGPNLLDELTTTATRQHRTAPANDGARPTSRPLPFAPHAAQVLADDARFLVKSAVRHDAPARLRQTRDAVACARWLEAHLDVIVGRPDGPAFVADIIDRHARALRAIDRPADTWYAGRCIQCGADLYALDGAARIDCAVCNACHDVAAQRRRLLDAVEDTLATATEICRAVHLLDRAVTRSQIDNWVARGQLIRRGRSLAGAHTYRVGDVLDLVART